ncbi:MAG TPA: hypothetical protein VHW71_11285 [Steroidobacteraceae bacterium]|nr:hypothetical protein [Steroidobacteraceae bacterium]
MLKPDFHPVEHRFLQIQGLSPVPARILRAMSVKLLASLKWYLRTGGVQAAMDHFATHPGGIGK